MLSDEMKMKKAHETKNQPQIKVLILNFTRIAKRPFPNHIRVTLLKVIQLNDS